MKMEVKVVGKKLIKPCTPTPPNLRNYRISCLDEMAPEMDFSILIFYQSKSESESEPKQTSQLEESLAKILPHFYPLAGRFMKKARVVDCSDQGVEFVEAEAEAPAGSDHELADILKATTAEQLKNLLPRIAYRPYDANDPILSIQITNFQRGGLVIGISISHKICDGASLSTLLAAWADASYCNPQAGRESIILPSFEAPSLFPLKAEREKDSEETDQFYEETPEVVVKRFSFSRETITRVRSELMANDNNNNNNNNNNGARISKVRVVTAVVSKALMGAPTKYTSVGGSRRRGCIIAQAIDIRGRTGPPLHKYAFGNLVVQSFTPSISQEIGLQELVSVLGDSINDTISTCAGLLSSATEAGALKHLFIQDEMFLSGEQDVLLFSDWSKFGFYEADFGWGNPVWACSGAIPAEKMVVLMESAERDGIEAWVHLTPEDMACFEQQLFFFNS